MVTPVSRKNAHAELVVVMEWGRIVDEALLMRGLRFSCVEEGGDGGCMILDRGYWGFLEGIGGCWRILEVTGGGGWWMVSMMVGISFRRW